MNKLLEKYKITGDGSNQVEKWTKLCKMEELSEKFIRKYEKFIDWSTLSNNHNTLSIDLIEKYQNRIFDGLWRQENLSEEFIERNLRRVNWEEISQYVKLSESFMKKYKDQLDWTSLTQYKVLSEDFMREMRDYIDWTVVSANQRNLSINFVREFYDKLCITLIYIYGRKDMKRLYAKNFKQDLIKLLEEDGLC